MLDDGPPIYENLPPMWTKHKSLTGFVWYYHRETQTVTWTTPAPTTPLLDPTMPMRLPAAPPRGSGRRAALDG